jgi:DNA recombination protein RmuC
VYFVKNSKKFDNENDKLINSLQKLSEGQQQLFGSLRSVTENQSASNANILKHFEERLIQVQNSVTENLSGSATKTAQTLGELQQRLVTIDKAQSNLEKLSGNVLSLQDILSNKQARGAFGEIQLNDIVTQALPADSYTFQATLSNGKRVDCLVNLPNPPGPISIDSKFPLESYEVLRSAQNENEKVKAAQLFKNAVKTHIKAISERYIIDGETAEGALMFLPSEAIYAELHSNFSTIVREGFSAKVWIVSPTTCMATLNTMRAVLKDARMKEQAGRVRSELGLLHKDVQRLESRTTNLSKHFELASRDVEDIRISAKKASSRAIKLDRFEFDDLKIGNGVELDKI